MEYFDWLVKFRDENYKGCLHMTYYEPLSDFHTNSIMKNCILIRLQ